MKNISILSAVLILAAMSAVAQAGVRFPAVESRPTANNNAGDIVGCECPCGCPGFARMLRNLSL